MMTLTEIVTAAVEIFRPLIPLWAAAVVVIDTLTAITTGLVILALG
jgi:hypothetical protein